MYLDAKTTLDGEIIHMIDETLPHVGFEVALVLYAWAERRKGVGMSVTPEYLKWLWQDEKKPLKRVGAPAELKNYHGNIPMRHSTG